MPMPLPQDEIIAFLSQVPPFHLVDTGNLTRITGNISLEYYPRGTRVLLQEGPAVDFLRVIKKGGVKIWIQASGAEETTRTGASKKASGLFSQPGSTHHL